MKKVAVNDAPAVRKSSVGRRMRGKIEKRRKIIEAASHLFITKGYDETTTSEIAERADIGSGTLFTYAKTKDDLLLMVFHEEILELNRRSFKGVSSKDTPLQQLMFVFSRMIEYHAKDIQLHRRITSLMLSSTSDRRHQELVEELQLVHGGIAEILRGADKEKLKEGVIDYEAASSAIFAIFHMNLLKWLSGLYTKHECVEHLERELDVVIRGFSPA